MKKLLIVIFTILLTACSTSSRVATPEFSQKGDSTVKEVSHHRTLIMSNLSNLNNTYYCSAAVIKYKDKVRVITNNHCCGHDLIMYKEGLSSVLKTSPTKDLCEISPIDEKEGIELAESTPKLTSTVTMIGSYPFYNTFVLNPIEARIIGYDKFTVPQIKLDADIVLTNREVYHGMSGGPVVANGKLVGINMVTFLHEQRNMSGFIPVEVIRAFLDE